MSLFLVCENIAKNVRKYCEKCAKILRILRPKKTREYSV